MNVLIHILTNFIYFLQVFSMVIKAIIQIMSSESIFLLILINDVLDFSPDQLLHMR